MPQVRTRMAPSPTGEYHIGGMRTLLYNYAFARKNNGKFILRIEDTDRERHVEGAAERLVRVIKDYGLNCDEGPEVGGPFEPYIQSQRLDIYKKHALDLINRGYAYYCFCTEERLEKLREEQRKTGLPTTKYDRQCLNLEKDDVEKRLNSGEPHVIRLKVPENEEIIVKDLVLGEIKFNSQDIDDQVLLKSDGFPTYHLAVVVDDRLMEISHVLRGLEWLPSTPKHILLYKYFGWELPVYGHLPLLKEVGENKKLSKRMGSVSAQGFLEDGYLPEALLNFLMFLGWNPGTEKEIYSIEEFIQDFSLEKVQISDMASFDRMKLKWYNSYYIRNLSEDDFYNRLTEWSEKYNYDFKVNDYIRKYTKEYFLKVLKLIHERLQVFSDIKELTSYFFKDPVVNKDMLLEKSKDREAAKDILNSYINLYSEIIESDWNKENLDKRSHEVLLLKGFKTKEAFMTLRIALTGMEATPPLFDVLGLMKKEIVLKRLEDALSLVS